MLKSKSEGLMNASHRQDSFGSCRRLLEMGFVNAQIMNNIGLCSFFAQQFDVSLSCFKRALALAEGEESANIWYNLSHIAIVSAILSFWALDDDPENDVT